MDPPVNDIVGYRIPAAPAHGSPAMQFHTLQDRISSSPGLSPDWLFDTLQELCAAPAPSGSALLPGSVADVLHDRVRHLGLLQSYHTDFRHTHNAALALGAARDPDLVITAHADKPGFGVQRLLHPREATLFPCCAVRFGDQALAVAAMGTRFNRRAGRLEVASRGQLHYQPSPSGPLLRYIAHEGDISAQDMITMFHAAERRGDLVRANSLDDCAGLATLLGVAAALQSVHEELAAAHRSLLLVFSDFEEWPASSTLFGLGAMRLGYAIRPPAIGTALVDTHAPGPVSLGQGLAYGFTSAQGRGAPVPLDARALQDDLAAHLNSSHPRTAQHNGGYFSRSDDFGLMRWSRVVGLFGIPVENIHGGPETCSLHDVAGAVRFITSYLATLLGLVDLP